MAAAERARRCCFLFGCSLRSSVVSSDALPSRHRHPLVRFQRLIGCKRVHLRGWLQHATHCQLWSVPQARWFESHSPTFEFSHIRSHSSRRKKARTPRAKSFSFSHFLSLCLNLGPWLHIAPVSLWTMGEKVSDHNPASDPLSQIRGCRPQRPSPSSSPHSRSASSTCHSPNREYRRLQYRYHVNKSSA